VESVLRLNDPIEASIPLITLEGKKLPITPAFINPNTNWINPATSNAKGMPGKIPVP